MSSTCRRANVAEMRRGSSTQEPRVCRYGRARHVATVKVLFSPESARSDAAADSSGRLLVSIRGAGKSMEVISCLMLMT